MTANRSKTSLERYDFETDRNEASYDLSQATDIALYTNSKTQRHNPGDFPVNSFVN